MKTKIICKFDTVLEALKVSGIDVSYNLKEALLHCKFLDTPHPAFKNLAVYLCEDGKIRQLIECSDGLKILNTVMFFISVVDDGPFIPVLIDEEKETIKYLDNITFPKEHRAEIAKLNFIVS